jgi:hypothetical protein
VSDRFDDFAELEAGERARLARVHELLLAADPPPEVPPALATPPAGPARGLLPRRRRLTLAIVAAALALVAFGGGYLVGGREAARSTDFVLPLEGTAAAPAARGSLVVFERDSAGNWPMRLIALNLPPGAYELWLTKGGKPAQPCGRFRVADRQVEVELNAPYRFSDFDGWVVTPVGSSRPVLTT